ncbi:ArsR/SmtB family transcription factor [Paenactinomyces guangxiensis]|uniref:Winged helix-turn-helix transcriptional regulator n=1 Tax=Paenactinomyces guangxiensis TaxID=1490290 RepID=A0A7W1WPQ3_9BACL|nr:winged helix-turn-helix domain-containing protein [Paenactinomyces guangxiensis]MBA4493794.1 winged helix-turn-helix transcriptional regulator [Paenactinomyces guangxiensis]MBH8591260.1 winged helix-turn-helix transcriptional regulator [Paenactinomyces guangxiensis]
MCYETEIDDAPAYELVVSLYAYIHKKTHRYLDLGSSWIKETAKRLTPKLVAELEDERFEVLHRLNLLIWQCPGKRTPEELLQWLDQLPVSEIYERMVPWVNTFNEELGVIRDRMVYILDQWNQQYFQHFPSSLLVELKRDAQEKRLLLKGMNMPDFSEQVTHGVVIEPSRDIKKILFVPQYHCAPMTITDTFNGLITCQYPLQRDTNTQDEPPLSLMRMITGYADKNRLNMLRFIAQRPRSFTEIATHTGLAKSNVHYHLRTLRYAGLIRTHYAGGKYDRYSLREQALHSLQKELHSYIRGETK